MHILRGLRHRCAGTTGGATEKEIQWNLKLIGDGSFHIERLSSFVEVLQHCVGWYIGKCPSHRGTILYQRLVDEWQRGVTMDIGGRYMYVPRG